MAWSTAGRTLTVKVTQITKFMGPTWGPPGSCRPHMGPMLAPWTLLSKCYSSNISFDIDYLDYNFVKQQCQTLEKNVYRSDVQVSGAISDRADRHRSPSSGMGVLQWHHNERDGVSYHQPHVSLLNPLFKTQIKENIKAPRHWPLCGEFTSDVIMKNIGRKIHIELIHEISTKQPTQPGACSIVV